MRGQRAHGYSLVELLIVIGLLTLIAAIATPALHDDGDATLDRAAANVAAAIRFAHAESIRAGKPYGVSVSTSEQRVRVYRLDGSVSPPAVVYDVRDPVTKQLYELQFGDGNSDVVIQSYYFKFKGLFGGQSFVGFAAATGVPMYDNAGTIRLLETGNVQLALDGLTRTISVSPMTARVTVQ